jgi:hypothetical protein
MSATTPGRVIDQLNHEWQLLVTTASCARQVDIWLQRWPELQPLNTPEAGGAGIPQTSTRADEILAALLGECAAGDYLARRFVLQCMLPAVAHIARSCQGRFTDPADSAAEATAAMWQAITNPKPRHGKVAASLMLDALHAVAGRSCDKPAISEVPTEQLKLLALAELDRNRRAGDVLDPYDPSPTKEILEVLAWGVDAKALSPEEASVLTRLYAVDPYLPEFKRRTTTATARQAVAQELGISETALRKRTSRAIRRLADAVRDTNTSARHDDADAAGTTKVHASAHPGRL